jgi:farnesol dehydrogenase
MTKCFVTGATGFIGNKLIQELIRQNFLIHVLVRSSSDTFTLKHKNVTIYTGDITDRGSIKSAMSGCKYVIHLAAYAKIWPGNKNIFERINYDGTINVTEAAIECEVKKLILVSTAGVFGPSLDNKSINEESIRKIPYFNYYEETKDQTDQFILQRYSSQINLLIVCPSRVYGPGILNDSNSVTRLIKNYYKRKNILLPGKGSDIGNYVYIDSVVEGILLAMNSKIHSDRLILGGDNASFNQMFDLLGELTGLKSRKFYVPICFINSLAYLFQLLGRLKLITPPITPAWTRRYFYNWHISSEKAEQKLNYNPIKLKEGLKNTIEWLEEENIRNEAVSPAKC